MNTKITTMLVAILFLVTLFKIDAVNVARVPLMSVPLLINNNDVSSSKALVTVHPCVNHCDVACCNCNIEKNPPVCEQCCFTPPHA
ncbi:hypothetical protein ABFS83_11G063400 [Erythranthe nasuta]